MENVAIDNLIDINDSSSPSINPFISSLYADFSSHEFGSPEIKQVWGEYTKKPVAQEIWEFKVRTTAIKLAAEQKKADLRPHIRDKNTGRLVLLDTGAAVSVWPQADYPDSFLDSDHGLTAANRSVITSYGKKSIPIRFDRKNYEHKFTIAAIPQPILGWDFLAKHKMDIMWQNEGCVLYCGRSRSTYPLQMGTSHTCRMTPLQVNGSYLLAAEKTSYCGSTFIRAHRNL